MERIIIDTLWDRKTRNDINTNFDYLFKGVGTLEKTIEDLIIEAGESNPEVIQARGGEKLLGDRLDKIDTSVGNKVETSDFIEEVSRIDSSLESISDEIRERFPSREENKVVNLNLPCIVPHRGAKNIYQEHSMIAYESQVNRGNPLLEIDVQTAEDGGLVVMHDDKYSRTTDGNLTVTSSTNYYAKTLTITDKVSGGNGYKPQPVPFLDEVFKRFGVSATYIVESKDLKSAKAIVDMATQYGLKEYLIVQSFSLEDLKEIKDEGVYSLWLNNSMTQESIEDAENNNVSFLGCSKSKSDSYIEMLLSSGLPTFIYTINHRYDYERLKSLGEVSIFSDDPWYISDDYIPKKTDKFNEKIYMDGMLPSLGYKGEFKDVNKWGFFQTSSNSDERDYVLQGWMGRLPENFILESEIHFGEYVSGWAGIAISTPTDFFDDNHSEKSNGYNILISTGGNQMLYLTESGSSTILGSDSFGTIREPVTKKIEITVTSTTITLNNITDSLTTTVTNNTFRGGYVHFGRRSSEVSFSNVKLTY